MGFGNFLLVGKVNTDITADVPDVSQLTDSKHVASRKSGISVGGASANVATAIRSMDEASKRLSDIKVISYIGQMPEKSPHESDAEYDLACLSHAYIMPALERRGIRLNDLAQHHVGGGVPTNLVVQHGRGRDIYKAPPVLVDRFKESNWKLSEYAADIIDTEVRDVGRGGCVFVDPQQPILGLMAAQSCIRHKVPMIVDYGSKTWPESGSKDEERLMGILTRADIVIVPGDAVVKGMENNKKDPESLFRNLQSDVYKIPTIVMSDGSDPVQVFHKGKLYEIPVPDVGDIPLFANGVGDTRDGALMYFIARGDDVLDAIEKATFVASIKIQHPQDEWKNHIWAEMEGNPLFEDMIEARKALLSEFGEAQDQMFSTADNLGKSSDEALARYSHG